MSSFFIESLMLKALLKFVRKFQQVVLGPRHSHVHQFGGCWHLKRQVQELVRL